MPVNARRRMPLASKKGKKIESESSYTDVIVVPLGKAQRAVVTRSNLTKPDRRKRDQSVTSRRDSQKKVRFRDEHRTKMAEKTLASHRRESHAIKEEDVTDKSSPTESERKSIGSSL